MLMRRCCQTRFVAMKYFHEMQPIMCLCQSLIGTAWLVVVAVTIHLLTAAESPRTVERFPLSQVQLRNGIYDDIEKRFDVYWNVQPKGLELSTFSLEG